MTKQDLYVHLAFDLTADWHADWEMCTFGPADWAITRAIDDWLVLVREHPDVSLDAYQDQCTRLRLLYAKGRSSLPPI